MKYTKDQLIQEFLEQSKMMTKYVERLDGTLRQVNDDNRLHKDAILANTDAINRMVSSNDKFIKLFGVLMLILVSSLVVLAGAEKALEFADLFKVL